MSEAIIEIPKVLFATAESSYFEGTLTQESLEAGPDVYTFDEPLSWNVTISNTGEALLVDGTVSAVGATQCARCLEPIEYDLEGRIEGYYVLPGADDPEDMDDDEFERLPGNNVIDLSPLITAALLVDIPLLPLCSDDCKGICPDCGINLNEESCDCAEKRAAQQQADEEAANPFAALKDVKFDE